MRKIQTSLKVLSDDEILMIHNASLKVLANIGMKVPNDEVLGMCADVGCQVDMNTKVVKFPVKVGDVLLLCSDGLYKGLSEAEMAKINWAEKIFLEEDSDGKPVRVVNSDGTTVEDMDAFLEAIQVSDWTKVDALPADVTESGTFALRQNATIKLGETVSNTDYKIAQMTVYKEGYVTLEILDGMTKYLDILIPKENFVAVYQVPEDVAAYLQDCAA